MEDLKYTGDNEKDYKILEQRLNLKVKLGDTVKVQGYSKDITFKVDQIRTSSNGTFLGHYCSCGHINEYNKLDLLNVII